MKMMPGFERELGATKKNLPVSGFATEAVPIELKQGKIKQSDEEQQRKNPHLRTRRPLDLGGEQIGSSAFCVGF